MGKVYQNAFCNIAATGAHHGEEGCILPMPDDPVLALPLTVRAKWNGTGPGRKTDDPQFYVGTYWDMWQKEVSNAPLNCRAWVIQERFLSPRVLHFGTRQVIWECKKLASCELLPDGFTKQLRSDRLASRQLLSTIPTINFFSADINPVKEDLGAQIYRSWETIVRAYTSCGMTIETDRLIAIAGAYVVEDLSLMCH